MFFCYFRLFLFCLSFCLFAHVFSNRRTKKNKRQKFLFPVYFNSIDRKTADRNSIEIFHVFVPFPLERYLTQIKHNDEAFRSSFIFFNISFYFEKKFHRSFKRSLKNHRIFLLTWIVSSDTLISFFFCSHFEIRDENRTSITDEDLHWDNSTATSRKRGRTRRRKKTPVVCASYIICWVFLPFVFIVVKLSNKWQISSTYT